MMDDTCRTGPGRIHSTLLESGGWEKDRKLRSCDLVQRC